MIDEPYEALRLDEGTGPGTTEIRQNHHGQGLRGSE